MKKCRYLKQETGKRREPALKKRNTLQKDKKKQKKTQTNKKQKQIQNKQAKLTHEIYISKFIVHVYTWTLYESTVSWRQPQIIATPERKIYYMKTKIITFIVNASVLQC